MGTAAEHPEVQEEAETVVPVATVGSTQSLLTRLPLRQGRLRSAGVTVQTGTGNSKRHTQTRDHGQGMAMTEDTKARGMSGREMLRDMQMVEVGMPMLPARVLCRATHGKCSLWKVCLISVVCGFVQSF